MTYLVLARKYRPLSFDTLVGQDHVVRALTHALDTQRLHHAWLFTGTRGVGKTTLSRILAKSLNCESGITSKPCGVCQACTEIDSGRFVDYVELDAASNRGVDEMTQLLEQAVYSPGAGRFKVYMIDEVHMLTGHAFNAMLKTLEEPPPHVKFILATTDPQKIPVTVLSRCLQFNLKQMPPDAIVGHLRQVLEQEAMPADVSALRLISQAAGGSMRDALSLTDQAIAYSAGNLTDEAVRGMLGTIDQKHLVRLLQALVNGQAQAVIDVADELSMRGLSYAGALGDLAVLLSRVAIEQRLPGVTAADDPLAQDIAQLAQALHPDAVQLFYSVAVHSRGELALAPDEYAGFIMACLRMLALAGDASPPVPVPPQAKGSAATSTPSVDSASTSLAMAPAARATPAAPATVAAPKIPAAIPAIPATPASAAPATPAPAPISPARPTAPTPSATSTPTATPTPSATPSPSPTPAPALAPTPAPAPSAIPTPTPPPSAPTPPAIPARSLAAAERALEALADDSGPPPWVEEIIPEDRGDFSGFTADPDGDEFETLATQPATDEFVDPAERVATPRVIPPRAPGRKRSNLPRASDMTAADWPKLAAGLPLTGLATELARQSEWCGATNDTISLRVAVKTLADSASRIRLQTVLCEHFGQTYRLDIVVGVTGSDTAHAVAQSVRAALQATAEQAVNADPFVQALVSDFGGKVLAGSIRHVDRGAAI